MKTESHMSITDQWFVKHINVGRNFSRDEVQSRCYDSAWELYSVRFERKQTIVDPGVASQNFPRLSITTIKRQKPVNVIINTTHKRYYNQRRKLWNQSRQRRLKNLEINKIKKNTKFHWRTQNYSDLLDFTFPNDTSMKVNVLNSIYRGLSYR